MSKKHKKVSIILDYTEHFLILVFVITRCDSISFLASIVCITIGITSSAVGLKICAITAGIKKHKSIIKSKKKKHDKIVLLAKTKLNSLEVLNSKALTDSYISHDEFVLLYNVSEEYDNMKEKIKK